MFGPFAPRTYLLPILLSANAISFSMPYLSETLLEELLELLLELLELLDELELVLVSFLVEGSVAAFFALEEFIIVSVTPPTLPSAVSPARFWNALTASSVLSPKYPVAFAPSRRRA